MGHAGAEFLGRFTGLFGLGGFLAYKMTGFIRLYGVGLMCGWTFMTLFSLGFCTGINT